MADESLSTWQKLVVITGGDIALDKSSISVMSWVMEHGKEMTKKDSKINGKLILHSMKLPEYKEDVTHLDPKQGGEILEVYVAMNGKDTEEHKQRLIQVKALAGTIRSSPLDRYGAETVYQERWVPSIGYCLPFTQFTLV